MNFNLYLDAQTVRELDRAAGKLGETRGGLIRKREWLGGNALHGAGWPSLILEWQGVPDVPPFESYRGELRPPPRRCLFVKCGLDANMLSGLALASRP